MGKAGKVYVGEDALRMARAVHLLARVLKQSELHLAGEYEDVIVVLDDRVDGALLDRVACAHGDTAVVCSYFNPQAADRRFEVVYRQEY